VKANTAIGIGAGVGCLLLAVLMEGGSPMSLVSIPAFVIVVGGTGAATFASVSFAQATRIPALYRKAFRGNDFDSHATIRQLVRLAEKARRDGLLALENELEQVGDDFTRKGVQLVVDGTDSDLVRAILTSELDAMAERHRANVHVFAAAGGYAPTLGIIGTVLSLVHVLENLSSPGTLGHAIASAFIATLYGVGSANLVFLPVSKKLELLAAEELAHRELQLEGILSIQAGDNPRMLGEKLETFLAPSDRAAAAAPGAREQADAEMKEAA